jgi:hypothetical protein
MLKLSFLAVVVANAVMLLSCLSPRAQDLLSAAKPSILFEKDGTAHIVDLRVPILRKISPQAESIIQARHAAHDLTRGLTASIETLRRLTYCAEGDLNTTRPRPLGSPSGQRMRDFDELSRLAFNSRLISIITCLIFQRCRIDNRSIRSAASCDRQTDRTLMRNTVFVKATNEFLGRAP